MTGPRAALDGWRPIVGTPAQVRDAVAAAKASGRYDAMTPPRYVPGRRDQVYVHIRARHAEPPAPQWRWPVIAGVAFAAVSVTVTVLAATWALTVWRQLLGAGIVALALMAAVQRARR